MINTIMEELIDDIQNMRKSGENDLRTVINLAYNVQAKIAIEVAKMEDSKKYLEERDKKLSALESAGVDNWQGYGYAMEEMEEDE